MKSILFLLSTVIFVSLSAQSVPTCFKKPNGELKVIFTSVYKIKPTYYGVNAENDPDNPLLPRV